MYHPCRALGRPPAMDVEASSRTSKKKKLAVPKGEVLPAPEAVEPPEPRSPPSAHNLQPPTGVVGADGGGADRISDLPDAVLGEIITLLPTGDGARTQILSPRWRHLWRSAPLNLDCRDRADRDVPAEVVTQILSSHQGPVRRFCVPAEHILRGVPESDLWLRSPALDKLQEIEFIYIENCLYHLMFVQLPPSIFRFSATLLAFTLGKGRLSDDITRGLHFPLLKHLTLQYVHISDCSLHSLISGCPALECLFIDASGFRSLKINSFTLRSVFVRVDELIIQNAPCLERLLSVDLRRCQHVSVVSAPKLEALGYFVDQKFSSTTPVFGSTVTQELPDDILTTAMHRVKILAIHIHKLSLDTIIELLRYFPCLEKLYVAWYCCGPRNLRHASLDIPLKTIVLGSYRGKKSEANFARFFVLHAKELELMTLTVPDKSYNNDNFVDEQRRELQVENSASKGAQFHFTPESDSRVHNVMRMEDARDLDVWDPFKC